MRYDGDDDELVTLDKLLEVTEENPSPTWGTRLRQWSIIGLIAVAVLVIGGFAAIGILSVWLSVMLS